MGLRTCTKCGGEFPATTEYFYKHANANGGLHTWCKTCHRAMCRSYRSEHREQVLAWDRAYHMEHRETRNSGAHQRYVENIVYRRDYARAQLARQRALKASAVIVAGGQHHTAADIANQFKLQDGRCFWCGVSVPESYHVDHYIPLSRGGSNGPENIVISCRECNRDKGNLLPDEFCAELSRKAM